MIRWPTKPLGKLSETVMGQAPPGNDCNSDGTGTLFVKAGEFGERYPIVREWTTKPLKFAKSTDVLVCVVGATCGKLNLGVDCAIGRSVAAIRPNPSLLNQRFLYAFLQGWTLRLRSGSQGSAQGVITREMLANIPMPLPPLAEQERIVKLLGEADELRKLRAQSNRRTADLIPSLFHDMFGDPVSNPKGWPARTIGELASFITSGSRGWARYYSESGAKFVRVQNLAGHQLTFSDIAYVSSPENAESKRTKVHPNDLLVSITGVVGLVAQVPANLGDAYISQHVAIVRLRDGIDATFAAMFLADRSGGQRQIAELQYGQTKPGLNLDQLRSIYVYLPPQSLQGEFATRVAEIRAMQIQQAASGKRLNDLFASLLHRAFRGEL